jgi:DNA topoisomerase VI subunit A
MYTTAILEILTRAEALIVFEKEAMFQRFTDEFPHLAKRYILLTVKTPSVMLREGTPNSPFKNVLFTG